MRSLGAVLVQGDPTTTARDTTERVGLLLSEEREGIDPAATSHG